MNYSRQIRTYIVNKVILPVELVERLQMFLYVLFCDSKRPVIGYDNGD